MEPKALIREALQLVQLFTQCFVRPPTKVRLLGEDSLLKDRMKATVPTASLEPMRHMRRQYCKQAATYVVEAS